MIQDPISNLKSCSLQESKPSSRLEGVRVIVLFGGSDLFGQERANIEVFCALRELGLEAKFIISSQWADEHIRPELEAQGFNWIKASFGYHWGRNMLRSWFYYLFRNVWGMAATSWVVWREVRRWDATHIYAPNWLHLSYAWPALSVLRLPLIYRAGDELPTHTWVHRHIVQSLFERVYCLVSNSEFIWKGILRAGIPKSKTRVIYNHPPKRPRTEPQASPPLLDKPVVIYIGQIAAHKGVVLLVEAALRLLKMGYEFQLWIVGNSTWGNPIQTQLDAIVTSSGYSEVIHFLGYRSDVPDLLRLAAVHVCPSIWDEPSPNVVFEAKMQSVPSIVFNCGGLPELINHKWDGFVCSERTVDGLLEGIDYFLKDPENRHKAGVAARRSLEEKFGYSRFRNEWAEVFLPTAQK